MEVKDNMDAIIAYTKQFIDASSPALKHAYDVGLTTLQIDAAQSVLVIFVGFVLFGLCFWYSVSTFLSARKALTAKVAAGSNRNVLKDEEVWDSMPTGGVMQSLILLFGFLCGAAAFVFVLDIWMWVKLFNPQLWLVHHAIDVLLK
jgi:hypothetical protein